LAYVPLEKMLKEGKTSLYKLVIAAAGRANELSQGATPLVQSSSKKVSAIALQEIAAGKVHYEEIKPKSKKAAG